MEKNEKIIKQENREIGVFYEDSKYASLIQRVIIISVDGVMLIVFGIMILTVWTITSDNIEEMPLYLFYIWLIVSYVYMSVIRIFGIRTLGNILTSTKVVNLEGKNPTLFQMTLRFFMLVLGPINFLLDLFWLTNDPYKQTLRDKFAATYVIDKNASPLGTGVQTFSNYQIMGFSFVFREVKKLT